MIDTCCEEKRLLVRQKQKRYLKSAYDWNNSDKEVKYAFFMLSTTLSLTTPVYTSGMKWMSGTISPFILESSCHDLPLFGGKWKCWFEPSPLCCRHLSSREHTKEKSGQTTYLKTFHRRRKHNGKKE
jgi:hypothetical protein